MHKHGVCEVFTLNPFLISYLTPTNYVFTWYLQYLVYFLALPFTFLLSDFRNYVQEPYLLITTLRNPLELFVSALQFKNREQTRTLSGAVQLTTESMRTGLRYVFCCSLAPSRFASKQDAPDVMPGVYTGVSVLPSLAVSKGISMSGGLEFGL